MSDRSDKALIRPSDLLISKPVERVTFAAIPWSLSTSDSVCPIQFQARYTSLPVVTPACQSLQSEPSEPSECASNIPQPKGQSLWHVCMRYSTVAVWGSSHEGEMAAYHQYNEEIGERFQRGDWNSKVQASIQVYVWRILLHVGRILQWALRGNAQIWLSIAVAVAVAADAAAGSQNGRFLIRIELKINENSQPGLQNGRFLIRI